MALISVVVPVYKVEKYLDRCIKSILSQIFKDFQLILVDDGSPDNCPKMCDEWSKKDDRIYVIHKGNGGLSDARNFGIDYALKTESRYITFIDSDDIISPYYLEVLYNASVKNNADISVANFSKFSDEKDFYSKCKAPGNDFKVYSLEEIFSTFVGSGDEPISFTSAWTKLYKKELFKEIRFPKGKIFEDEFTTYKLYYNSKIVVKSEFIGYGYFSANSGSITNNLSVEKWLECYEAKMQKIKFYLEKDYIEIFKKSLIRFLYLTQFNLKKINDGEKINNPQRKKEFINDFRYCLKMVKKYKVASFNEMFHYYVLAYPNRTLYYKIKRLLFK